MIPQNNIDITPENSHHSLIIYPAYPVKTINATSEIPFSVSKKRKFLKIRVVIMPVKSPMKMEATIIMKKFKNKEPIADASAVISV